MSDHEDIPRMLSGNGWQPPPMFEYLSGDALARVNTILKEAIEGKIREQLRARIIEAMEEDIARYVESAVKALDLGIRRFIDGERETRVLQFIFTPRKAEKAP